MIDAPMPMQAIIERAFRKHLDAKMAQEEALLRRLLGAWVSEFEPSIVRDSRTLEIKGLTAVEMPLGSYPPVFNPFN